MNLSEEGHVFDHEPGMSDYHHGREHHPESDHHAEYYADAHYPVFLEHREVEADLDRHYGSYEDHQLGREQDHYRGYE